LGFYKQSFERRKEEMKRENQAAKDAAKKNPPSEAEDHGKPDPSK
jgi:hypothetical protein